MAASRNRKKAGALAAGASGSVWGAQVVAASRPVPGRVLCAAITPPPPATRPRGHVGGGRPSLNELHVVGREHAKVAVGPVAAPPAFINHLDARDEVLRVKGDLGIVSCKGGELRCRTGGPGALVAQHQPSLPRRCSSGLSPSTPSRRVRLWACAPAKGWRQYFPPCVSLCPEATPQSSLCAPTCRLYN